MIGLSISVHLAPSLEARSYGVPAVVSSVRNFLIGARLTDRHDLGSFNISVKIINF